MKRRVGIHIGGIYATKEPVVIETVLGSCVAVCLYDAEKRIGGMNHIFLPGEADLKHFDTPARYGINAMELLINRITALGGNRRRVTAKAFGGAHVLPAISQSNGMGRKNVEFVCEFLRIEGIELIGHDLGGYSTRKVLFHTDTGDAFLKVLGNSSQQNALRKELKHAERVKSKANEAGEITLFS
jgi:chemotaxis protein CheD